MPDDSDQQHPPMLNLQQCFTERALAGHLAGLPGVSLRWGHAMRAIVPGPDGVRLTIGTPTGDYTLDAAWVAAADGARSPTRAALGLALEGSSHEGRYLIADIRLNSRRPTERRAWFDPPSNPGSTVLMHRQPGDVWRIDYQLRADEDAEAAQREDAVRARIDAHLAAIGETADYALILISLYRAHELTLPAYRHGRVLLLGDAAHLLPIFGVRGMNSGIEDAGSLAWMLAACARGEAPPALLDAWSAERVAAARENIRQAHKSTLFMTPPTPGHALLRDAALSLAVSQDWARALADPRQSAAVPQPASPLVSPEEGVWPAGTPAPGALLPAVPLARADGTKTHLADLLGAEAALLICGESPVPGRAALRVIRVGRGLDAVDDAGRAAALLGLDTPGAGYLVRPDGLVAWRWRRFEARGLEAALARMLARVGA
jgi:3-(3-hydroxy-phenyl)propionate hydroxylase